MARHIGLALICALCWTIVGCSKRSAPAREPPNDDLTRALVQASLANLLGPPQSDDAIEIPGAPKPPAARAEGIVPSLVPDPTSGTQAKAPEPPSVTELTNLKSSEQSRIDAVASIEHPGVTELTNLKSSEQPTNERSAPSEPAVVTEVTNETTITNDAARAEQPALDADAPQVLDEPRQVEADAGQAPSAVAEPATGVASAVAPQDLAAEKHALETRIQSSFGAGPGFTGISAGTSGDTGVGAGSGSTGIGAGSGYTGIGAGSGYTGFGAGSGSTGFGAGSGYTGIGAESKSVTRTPGDSDNYGGWGVVMWFTPWGPVYTPVAVR